MNLDKISLSDIFDVTHVCILFKVLQRPSHWRTSVKEVDRFGWMTSTVEVVRHLLQSAPSQVLVEMTVLIPKMLGSYVIKNFL